MKLRDLKELKPDTVYVLEVESRLSQDVMAKIRDEWKTQAPKGAKLMIIDGAMKLSEVTPERLRELGLIP